MSVVKSPISILQELTQMKNWCQPVYQINLEVTGYRCTGFVNNISATAVAVSKKDAKHLCAKQLLEMLQSTKNTTLLLGYITHNSVCENPDQNLQLDAKQLNVPTFNAIGKLNELCSQNCKQIPTYSELGIVNQKYVIECNLLSHTTQGQASTKKGAKQIAAKEMLSRITLAELIASNSKIEETKIKLPHQDEMDEKVIEIFKKFSLKNKKFSNNHISKTETIIIEKETPHKVDSTMLLLDDDISEGELRAILSNMGVSYEICELQNNPLILMLKTNPIRNHPSYTFLFSGATYNVTVIGLLKQSVHHIHVMFN